MALFFAWAFELTPEGLKKEKDVDRSQSITNITGRRFDYLIIMALIFALGYFAFDKFVLDPSRDADLVQTTTEAVTEQATRAGNAETADKSIAVLPFINMSDDAANEYFSDGITEEILNLLSKITQLRVVSRSSAFAFKGKETHIPDVAQKLNVAYVLEGSVRKSGQRVRITAQLIEASTDTHRWSETYDRTLDDIFAVQDEIAAAVTTAMKLILVDELPTAEITNPEAHELLLQGNYFYHKRTADNYARAIEYFRQAIAMDPDYSHPWSALGATYTIQASMGSIPYDEGYQLAREANEKALSLDPNNSSAHSVRAWIAMMYERDYALAASHFRRARILQPNSIAILANSASLAAIIGRLKRSIELNQRALKLDPANPIPNANLAIQFCSLGRLDDAESAARKALELNPNIYSAPGYLAIIDILKGEPAVALERADAIKLENLKRVVLAIAHYDLGNINESNRIVESFIEDHADRWAYYIAWVYAWRKENDPAFEWLQRAVDEGQEIDTIKTEVLLQNLHEDPRWEELLTNLGLSDSQVAAIEI
jgi:TolB-like protein/Flp pilus assembly protein TadD